MTIMAYRDGVLAADTLVTAATHRDGYTQKIFKAGSILFAASGSHAMAIAFTDWIRQGLPDDLQPVMEKRRDDKQAVAYGYVFLPDGMFLSLNPEGWTRARTRYWAGGSGCDYAYGAMAMGATAEEAVRAAILFDTGCGGIVTVLRH